MINVLVCFVLKVVADMTMTVERDEVRKVFLNMLLVQYSLELLHTLQLYIIKLTKLRYKFNFMPKYKKCKLKISNSVIVLCALMTFWKLVVF
jgi:hypothetical protein